MGVTAAVIAGGATLLSTGISLAASSGGPSYPSPPKMYKLPVAKAKKHMEKYEAERMQASIDAWKEKYPLLYEGGKAELDQMRAQQLGGLGKNVEDTLKASGLSTGGTRFGSGKATQEARALDLGLNPLALSQRTSQAVLRNIALNPEWTNKISGGTLASMMANANANQNAFTSFMGAQKSAMYQQGQAQGAMNTATLLEGITGAAGVGMNAYESFNSPYNLGGYQAGSSYGGSSGGGGGGGSGGGGGGYAAPPQMGGGYGNDYASNNYNIAPNPWGNQSGAFYQPVTMGQPQASDDLWSTDYDYSNVIY